MHHRHCIHWLFEMLYPGCDLHPNPEFETPMRCIVWAVGQGTRWIQCEFYVLLRQSLFVPACLHHITRSTLIVHLRCTQLFPSYFWPISAHHQCHQQRALSRGKNRLFQRVSVEYNRVNCSLQTHLATDSRSTFRNLSNSNEHGPEHIRIAKD